MDVTRYYATGKRKTSVARVWIYFGKGDIIINRKSLEDYFPYELYRKNLLKPFVVTNTYGQYNILATVKGGGPNGQSDAIRHGIAKALLNVSEDYRGVLKREGLLTRDPRVKERKKYGQKGARARFQFSKR